MGRHRTKVEVWLNPDDIERMEAQQLAKSLSRAGVLRLGLRVLEQVESYLEKKISD
jgi:hypothetical protein